MVPDGLWNFCFCGFVVGIFLPFRRVALHQCYLVSLVNEPVGTFEPIKDPVAHCPTLVPLQTWITFCFYWSSWLQIVPALFHPKLFVTLNIRALAELKHCSSIKEAYQT